MWQPNGPFTKTVLVILHVVQHVLHATDMLLETAENLPQFYDLFLGKAAAAARQTHRQTDTGNRQ